MSIELLDLSSSGIEFHSLGAVTEWWKNNNANQNFWVKHFTIDFTHTWLTSKYFYVKQFPENESLVLLFNPGFQTGF